MALLELRKISKYFGGLAAVRELDMEVNQGEILGLIGPNGAGKTTIFNLITGTLAPDKGKVAFEGKRITGLEPHFVAKRGIARTFQLATVFPNLTVLKNVLVGLQLVSKVGFWETLLNTGSKQNKNAELNQRAMEILSFMGIASLSSELAVNLPYGFQRALSIAIALAAKPKILLLDEPLAGMNPKEVTTMMGKIREIRDGEGVTIVVVEHNIRAVTILCERIIVVNFGQKIAEGSAEEVRNNQDVIDAYLGSKQNVT